MRSIFHVDENAEFDHGHEDIDPARLLKLAGRSGTDFADKGKGGQKQRTVDARFGDNPLEDATLNELDGGSLLDRLQDILQAADISEDEIKAGFDLSERGRAKVAAQLGIGPDEVPVYLASLRTKLARDDRDLTESYRMVVEGDDEEGRFTYEKDSGGVTVRDSEAGTETYLQGTEGFDLLKRLKASPDKEQEMLGRYAKLMEGEEADAAQDDAGSDFDEEMDGKGGTYNFPWKLEGETGTATASFAAGKDKPVLKLVSVRDTSGDEVHPDEEMRDALLDQAQAFIGDA